MTDFGIHFALALALRLSAVTISQPVNLLPPPAPLVRQRALVQPMIPPKLFLAWNYPTNEPWAFQVYHSTNLAGMTWLGGTNIPSGFVLWTNTTQNIVPIPPGMAQEFFIVRATNFVGVSDWNVP